MPEATSVGGNGADSNPTLLLVGPVVVGGARLSKVLSDAGLSSIEIEEDGGVSAFLSCLPVPPDLLILPLAPVDDGGIKILREIRQTERGRRVPVLGVVAMGAGLDLRTLRAHGVVGVIDERQAPGVALDRIVRMLGPLCHRGSERASCLFPVGVRLDDGPRRREFAVNLSATGMRMTSRLPLEPNTDVSLRFRLPMTSDRTIEAKARVVHRLNRRNSWGRYEVGLFFYPLGEDYREILTQEVDRLLTR